MFKIKGIRDAFVGGRNLSGDDFFETHSMRLYNGTVSVDAFPHLDNDTAVETQFASPVR